MRCKDLNLPFIEVFPLKQWKIFTLRFILMYFIMNMDIYQYSWKFFNRALNLEIISWAPNIAIWMMDKLVKTKSISSSGSHLFLYQCLLHPRTCINYFPSPPITLKNKLHRVKQCLNVAFRADHYRWPMKNNHFSIPWFYQLCHNVTL